MGLDVVLDRVQPSADMRCSAGGGDLYALT
jgi:hypothetical protein